MKKPKQQGTNSESRKAEVSRPQENRMSMVRYLSYVEAMIRLSNQNRDQMKLTPLPVLQ